MNKTLIKDLQKKNESLELELQDNLDDTILSIDQFDQLKLHQALGYIFDDKSVGFGQFTKPALEFYPNKYELLNKEVQSYLTQSLNFSKKLEAEIKKKKWKIKFEDEDVEKEMFLAMWKVSQLVHTKRDKSLCFKDSFKQFIKTLEILNETHEDRRKEALGYCIELEEVLIEIFGVVYQLSFHIEESLNLASFEEQIKELWAAFSDKPDCLSLIMHLANAYIASSSDAESIKNKYLSENKDFFFLYEGMTLRVKDLLKNLESFLSFVSKEDEIQKNYETYQIKVDEMRNIVLNNKYKLSKPDFNEVNDLFFKKVYESPLAIIELKELQAAGFSKQKSIRDAVTELGFKGKKILTSIFWDISKNAVKFKNPTTSKGLSAKDILKLNIEIEKLKLLEK